MAKRRSRKARGAIAAASLVDEMRFPPPLPYRAIPALAPIALSEVDDGRRWRPYPVFAPALVRSAARIIPAKPAVRRPGRLPSKLAFAVPRHVLVCIRRKQRREVMFARGRGGTRVRRPRWKETSNIQCR